jgi:hypothetical protein
MSNVKRKTIWQIYSCNIQHPEFGEIPYNESKSMRVISETAKQKPGRLVVELFIGLLAVLVVLAIFYPAQYGRDTKMMRYSSCHSSLKNVILGVQIYLSDNDDILPNHYTFDGQKQTDLFIEATQPYLKNYQTYICPENTEALKAAQTPTHRPGEKHAMSYVHCLSLKGLIPDFERGDRSLSVPSIEQELAKTPYMREPIISYGNPEGDQPGPAFLSAHKRYPIIGYLDGHVNGKSPLDIATSL